MAADRYRIPPPEGLYTIARRIVNEVRGINRAVYDYLVQASQHDRMGVGAPATLQNW